MDKLDKYFKEQLTDYNPSADEWTIPDEHLYDQAKVYFPKKKKRSFIFWILGLGLLFGGFSLGIYFSLYKTDSLVSDNTVSLIDTHQLISTQSNDEKINEEIIQSKSTIDNTKAKHQTKESYVTLKKESSTYNKSSAVKNETQISSENKITLTQKTSALNIKTSLKNTSAYNTKKQEIIKSENSNTVPTLSQVNRIGLLSGKNRIVEYHRTAPIIKLSSIEVIKKIRPYYKEESGVSHVYFLANFLDEMDLSDESVMELTKFSGKFKNINLNYSKYIHNRWSISSGIYFTQVNIDLNFSVFERFTTEDIDAFINEEFDDITPRASNQNKLVSLLPGANVNEGDLLNLRGDVQLQLQAIQIPILINYHLNKKNLEYLIGGGLALDYVFADQSAIDLEIYKDNARINEPFVQERQKENYLSYSIYFNTGVRYRISPNINVGFQVKLNLNELIFSGLEAGIYYRWNRTY